MAEDRNLRKISIQYFRVKGTLEDNLELVRMDAIKKSKWSEVKDRKWSQIEKNQRGAGNNKIFFSTKLYSVGGKKVDWGPIDLVQSTLKH